MKLTLELANGKKVVVENKNVDPTEFDLGTLSIEFCWVNILVFNNKNVDPTEFDLGTLSIEYLWEQLKAKIEAQRNG